MTEVLKLFDLISLNLPLRDTRQLECNARHQSFFHLHLSMLAGSTFQVALHDYNYNARITLRMASKDMI